MARTVPEWIGGSDDAKIPDRVKVRVFLRVDGRCAKCSCRIMGASGKWECDHIIALINGGKHRESNLQILCMECHKNKTEKDVAIKSKTYEMQKRHLGLKKTKGRPLPGSKRSGWKHKIGGGWERR